MLNNKIHYGVFLGSDTTSEAMQMYNHKSIGFELNPKYESIIKKRLNA